jgi:hypothetical protein
MELTIGQVSCVNAVGVVVARALFTNLRALLFLGTLGERESTARANAISWWFMINPRFLIEQPEDLNNRLLHSPDWPTILNSDTTSFSSVSKSDIIVTGDASPIIKLVDRGGFSNLSHSFT